MSKLLIVQEEELGDLKSQYQDMEEELAFLEHEYYSLGKRIQCLREDLLDKQHEIYNHLTSMEEEIDNERNYY